jgi:hypothetical protein
MSIHAWPFRTLNAPDGSSVGAATTTAGGCGWAGTLSTGDGVDVTISCRLRNTELSVWSGDLMAGAMTRDQAATDGIPGTRAGAETYVDGHLAASGGGTATSNISRDSTSVIFAE